MKECPACADESFVAQQFPMNFTGCQSIKVRTVPIDQLCDMHRKDRERIDSGVNKTAVERLQDGYMLRWKT